MSQKRKVEYKSTSEMADDVRQLSRGYEKVGGTWSLETTCAHVGQPLKMALKMPTDLLRTPEQEQMATRLADLLKSGVMPDNMPMPPGAIAPPDAGREAIDDLYAGLNALDAYGETHVTFGPFGPTSIEDFRKFMFIHGAHHFEFFRPTT